MTVNDLEDPLAQQYAGEDPDGRFDAALNAAQHREAAATAARWSESASGVEHAVNRTWGPMDALRKADSLSATDEADARAAVAAIREHLAALQRVTDAVAWRARQAATVAESLAAEVSR